MASAWALGKVPPGDWLPLSDGNPYERGTTVASPVDGTITKLRWRRMNTDAGDAPVVLRVWDVETETVLYTAPSVPDDGTVGWQEHPLTTPLSIDANQLVIISAQLPAGNTNGYLSLSTQYPPPDFPAGLATPPYRRTTAPSFGFPDLVDQGYLMAIDAEISGFLPTGSWESVGSTDYTETLKWGTPADRYRLTVTTIGEWKTAKVVEGLDVRRIVGFWTPLDGDYTGQRFAIDSPKTDLAQPNGKRMSGLLLDTGLGSAGTVEAFVFTA